MRKSLLVLAFLGLVLVALVAMRIWAVSTDPKPAVPPNIALGGINVATVAELLETDHKLEQARIRGDFDAYRRLTSDRMFTSTHNNEARTGQAFDQTTFKPRPKPAPIEGLEEGTLLAAARVGDTAALFYAVTKEWPIIGSQFYPITVKRFVLRNGVWVNDVKVHTAKTVLPKSPEEWLTLPSYDTIWAVDGIIYPAEPLLPPAVYPSQVALYSDALTTVKINGQLVAETKRKDFQKNSGILSVIQTLDAGLKKGTNTIEIVSQPLESGPTTQGSHSVIPFGIRVEVHHYGPSRKSVKVYDKKIAPGQSVSLAETFALDNPDAPAHPVTCQTCGK